MATLQRPMGARREGEAPHEEGAPLRPQPGKGGRPHGRSLRRSKGRRIPPQLLLWLLSASLLAAGSLGGHPLLSQRTLQGWQRAEPLLPVAAYLIAAWHPLSAIARRRDVQRHALTGVAALGAAVVGEVAAGALLLLLFSLQEAVLAWAFRKAWEPLERLTRGAPREATRRSGREERRVDIRELAVGDHFVVRPGEWVAVDGVVVEGWSEVDESLVTGERVLSAKGPSDPLFAGSVNQGGPLLVRAGAGAGESFLKRAALRFEGALKEKAPAQRRVERAARAYTPLVMLAGVALAAVPPLLLGAPLRPWLARGVLLLLLASPLPFLLAVPAAVGPALIGAARRGVYLKGPSVLWALGRVNAVAFDMTGTLTRGRYEVVETTPFGPYDPRELVALAAGIEQGAEHPIARAIAEEAARMGCSPVAMDSVRHTPALGAEASKGERRFHFGGARGMRAWGVQTGLAEKYAERLHSEGKEALILAEGGRAIGVIAFEDRVREESWRSLTRLRGGGGIDRIHLITGGSGGVAAWLAHRLELDQHRAQLRPEEKAEAVAAWRREGLRLALVGSGPSDVAAIEAAEVGIALGAARCRPAFEVSDVAVAGDELPKLPYLFALARRTRRALRRNLLLAAGVKAVALALASAGQLALGHAAVIEFALPLILVASGRRLAGRIRLSSRPARLGP